MTKTIASISPWPMEISRPTYGGDFKFPSVAKGAQPFLLEIPDHIQWEDRPHILGGGRVPRTITGEEIAEDIRQHLAEGALGCSPECGPGLWIVRDSMIVLDEEGNAVIGKDHRYVTRPATEAEKHQMLQEDVAVHRNRQDEYAAVLCNQGDVFASDAKTKPMIKKNPRIIIAAEYSGRDFDWMKEGKFNTTKRCMFCHSMIDVDVPMCPQCKQVVDPKKMAAIQASLSAQAAIAKAPQPTPASK